MLDLDMIRIRRYGVPYLYSGFSNPIVLHLFRIPAIVTTNFRVNKYGAWLVRVCCLSHSRRKATLRLAWLVIECLQPW